MHCADCFLLGALMACIFYAVGYLVAGVINKC